VATVNRPPPKKGEAVNYLERLTDKISDVTLFRDVDEETALERHRLLQAIMLILRRSIVPEEGMSPEDLGNEKKEANAARLQLTLANYGLMDAAIALFDTENLETLLGALRTATVLVTGGNEPVQEALYAYFVASPDPHFFTRCVRSFADARRLLKERRIAAMEGRAKKENGETSVIGADADDDDEELDALRAELQALASSSIEGTDESVLMQQLVFLKEMCEGHFRPLQDYLRFQHDNSKSFDLVKEMAMFGIFVESTVSWVPAKRELVNGGIATQVYRSLTEFCQGSPENVRTVADAKVPMAINKFVKRLLALPASAARAMMTSADVLHLLAAGTCVDLVVGVGVCVCVCVCVCVVVRV